MNKANLLIFSIFFLVILAAGTFVYFRFFLNQDSDTTDQSSKKVFSLSLTSAPEDGSSTFEKEVLIEGSTVTEAVVVINGGAEDVSTETVGGKFSLAYTLAEGENQITVVAFDQKTGAAKTLSREVFYSPEIKGL